MSEIIASGIVQKSTLQQWIDVFTPIVDEGKLHWNDDGIQIRCVDAVTAAGIIPGRLDASGFESYEPTGSVTQGVDLNRLEDMIKPAGSNALIELAIDMETRKLNIQFENVNTAMGLIDPDAVRQEPDKPDIDLPNKIILEGRQIRRVVDVADMVSDHVKMKTYADNNRVDFIADGDIDETVIDFTPDDRIDGEETKPVESLFSIQLLDGVSKPMPKDAEITMQFGEEFPMLLDWESNGGAVDVEQMLAPRIVTD